LTAELSLLRRTRVARENDGLTRTAMTVLQQLTGADVITVTPPLLGSTSNETNRDRLIILAASLAALTLVIVVRFARRRLRQRGKSPRPQEAPRQRR